MSQTCCLGTSYVRKHKKSSNNNKTSNTQQIPYIKTQQNEQLKNDAIDSTDNNVNGKNVNISEQPIQKQDDNESIRSSLSKSYTQPIRVDINCVNLSNHHVSVSRQQSIDTNSQRSFTINENSKFKPIDFVSRVDRLRFIDDSAASTISTAIQSPVENLTNPFMQNKFIDEINNNYRNRQQQSQMSTNPNRLLLKKQLSVNSSSTDTLCSNDTLENGQIERLSKKDEINQRLQIRHQMLTRNLNSRQNVMKSRGDTDSSCSSSLSGIDQARPMRSLNCYHKNSNRQYNTNGNRELIDDEKLRKFYTDSLSEYYSKVSQSVRVDCAIKINPYQQQQLQYEHGYFTEEAIYENEFECNIRDDDEVIEESDENDGCVEEESDKRFTSILVEDGFIRMSSPVDTDDNDTDTELSAIKSYQCDYCKLNSKSNTTRHQRHITHCTCYLKNFPNVGSSPVTEEAENLMEKNELFEEDVIENGKDYENDDNTSEDVDNLGDDGTSSSSTNSTVDREDCGVKNGEDEEEDEIIVYDDPNDSSTTSKSVVQSSVESITIVKPHSIIKKTSITKTTIDVNNDSTSSSTASGSESSSTQLNNANNKPKVRFNLDLNYEKEREWNRVNKIIGDVSKSHIEWTDEIEV